MSQTAGPKSGEPTDFEELAYLLAEDPDLTNRLLAEHVDDGTRHCRVCSGGGQSGRDVWPCRLYELAEQASKLAAGGPR